MSATTGVGVDDLLARLSPAERIAMLHQSSPALPRLGLRAFHTGQEALHGVAWAGKATVFPQAVGLAATWHPGLLERVGAVVGTEVRAKHAADPAIGLNVWAPVVNLLRDPRWGRNEEGYSEDPLLTTRLAIAYCRGLRGEAEVARVAPTLKHFLAYNNETDRSTTSSVVRPRVLHEYDLPVFAGPVAAGVVDAVMPSYNLVNGRPAHLSEHLNGLLRGWAGRELLVVSDAFAPLFLVDLQQYADDQAAGHAAALLAGVDSFTENGPDPVPTVEAITEAVRRGLISEADIDRAVVRVLQVRARTGEFDPEHDPYAGIGPGSIDLPAHRALAREAATEQVTLLRNEGALLPLRPGRIAVIGPLAEAVFEDWYSGTLPYKVSVTAGLRAHGLEVTGSEAVDRIALQAPAGPVGMAADAVLGCDGAPEHFDVFDWGDGVVTLRAAGNGRYVTVTDDNHRLVADQVQPHGWSVHETFNLLAQDDGTVLLRNLHADRYVRIEDGTLVASAAQSQDAERFRRLPIRDGLEQARAAARDADAVVLVVGNDPHINGRETQDRGTLALPPAQQALLAELAGPATVLLVVSSYPYALDDTALGAVVWTSHAGQELGNAVADVLLGVHAPTGRLPQTWYRDDADLPGLLEYDVIKAKRTYLYFDGTPLYPFGHGLTYTTFGYGSAAAALGAGTVSVTVEVTNTGARAGVEVVQVYTRFAGRAADRPVRRLQAFGRVALAAGGSRTVTLDFPVAGLAHWDVSRHAHRVDPGRYDILVGSSCTAIESMTCLEIGGEPAGPRPVVGTDVAAADFDDYAGVTLVDTTRTAGDAAQSVDARAWLLFRDADLGDGPSRLVARVSRTPGGEAALELRTGGPDGPLLSATAVPSTGNRYAWTEVTAPVGEVDGVHDLYLVLRGDLRLDSFRLEV